MQRSSRQLGSVRCSITLFIAHSLLAPLLCMALARCRHCVAARFLRSLACPRPSTLSHQPYTRFELRRFFGCVECQLRKELGDATVVTMLEKGLARRAEARERERERESERKRKKREKWQRMGEEKQQTEENNKRR